jgi:Flp pilus assembly protein TadD
VTSTTALTFAKARSDYLKGNESLAKSEFQALVKARPANKLAWYDLGVIAQQEGNNGEANSAYAKAISVDPTFESALYNEGVLRFQEGDLTLAASYLTRAVAADPNDRNARQELGRVLAARPQQAAVEQG